MCDQGVGAMDKALIEKIIQSVESLRSDLATAVSDVVKIKSVTPEFGWQDDADKSSGESAVARYTKAILDEMGVPCELYEKEPGRANLCGRHGGAGGGRSLLFNGHMDVVPPGDLANWGDASPFSGRIEDGYIHGRGSVDMKGGNMAAIFALKALIQAGIQLKGDVVFQHVVGEECKRDDAGTTACIERGYVADAAIVCEPTCVEGAPFMIHAASVGVLEMKWSVRGKACHVGLRGEAIREGGAGTAVGVDAFEKGFRIYNALKELERQWGQSKMHSLYPPGQFCINAATVTGGIAPSFVPPDMEMSYAITYPPQASASDIQREIENCIKDACLGDLWLQENPPELKWVFHWPAFDTKPEEAICPILQDAVKAICPEGGDLRGFPAVCDASFFQEKGIPVLVLGPGDMKCTHSAAEKVAIGQIADAAKIYAIAMALWCGVAKP
jgi:acetylornithine deacetylase